MVHCLNNIEYIYCINLSQKINSKYLNNVFAFLRVPRYIYVRYLIFLLDYLFLTTYRKIFP